MWYYITPADLEFFKNKVKDDFYFKLSAQCRARIPMLKDAFNKLKKQYD